MRRSIDINSILWQELGGGGDFQNLLARDLQQRPELLEAHVVVDSAGGHHVVLHHGSLLHKMVKGKRRRNMTRQYPLPVYSSYDIGLFFSIQKPSNKNFPPRNKRGFPVTRAFPVNTGVNTGVDTGVNTGQQNCDIGGGRERNRSTGTRLTLERQFTALVFLGGF